MQHLLETAVSLAMAIATGLTSTLIRGIRRLLGHKPKILPQLFYKRSKINDYLVENCTSLSRVFCPPWWMVNQHAQTIIPVFLRQPEMVFKREIVKLNDGGVLALDWAVTGAENLDPAVPIVIIIPGLAGDAAGYRHIAQCVAGSGYRPVVFNKRGHGGCKLITPKLQSFGDPTDFRVVLELIERKFPNAILTCIGISAGSGLLASYLGEEKENTSLKAAVGISPGYDAHKLFNEHLKPPYDFLLYRGLRKIIQNNIDVLRKEFDMKHILASTKVSEIEERLYCKIYGFKTITDYWKANNPMRGVANLRIPMLCISSRDDPVCPEAIIPFTDFTHNDFMMLAAMDHGGHVGFIEESTMASWADKTAVDYISSVLQYNNLKKE